MSNEKKRKILSDEEYYREEPALDEFDEDIFDDEEAEDMPFSWDSDEDSEAVWDEEPGYMTDLPDEEEFGSDDEDASWDDSYDDESGYEDSESDDMDYEEDEEYDESLEERIDSAMSGIMTEMEDEGYDDEARELEFQPLDKGRPVKQYKPQSSSRKKSHHRKAPTHAGKSARPRPVVYVPIDEEEMKIPEMPSGKKHKGLKVTGVAALMLLISAGCAYAGVSYYYSDKFFDGTTINGINCSRKTVYEVEQMIAENVEDFSIQVSSRNLEPQTISGDQIGYQYISNGEVMNLLKKQKPYEWIRGFFEPKSYTTSENITFSKEQLQNQVLSLNCAQEENQVAPENAYVAIGDSEFEIVPETEGSELNVKEAYQILDDAISNKQETVDFASSEDAYVTAAVTSDDPGLQATLNACNNFTRASITYTFGEETVTLDGSTIKNWLQFDEKGQLIQDDAAFQQHIADYVAQLAAQYDTVGTERAFYTTSGRTVYVYGSAYGWKIDQASETAQLAQEIQSGTQISRDPIYSMTANSRGYNDLGNTYIEVDLSDQHMYYYQNGGIIFESDIVSGLMSDSGRQTPSGIYTLYYKKSPDVLRGAQDENGKYEYETEVQYWMPFNGGIGFHDASWQPYFGGDRYLTGGSHGCINMPTDKAAELYSIIQYGVPIICFY